MKIEQLSVHNIKQLTALVLELWSDCDFEEELEDYKSIMNSENEICYLCRQQDDYIAFLHLSTRNDYVEGAAESPVAYIEGLYVKPDYQKQGIAKKLIVHAENWARQKGFKQIASDTEITNIASIDFHKKIGFEEAGCIITFIKDL